MKKPVILALLLFSVGSAFAGEVMSLKPGSRLVLSPIGDATFGVHVYKSDPPPVFRRVWAELGLTKSDPLKYEAPLTPDLELRSDVWFQNITVAAPLFVLPSPAKPALEPEVPSLFAARVPAALRRIVLGLSRPNVWPSRHGHAQAIRDIAFLLAEEEALDPTSVILYGIDRENFLQSEDIDCEFDTLREKLAALETELRVMNASFAGSHSAMAPAPR